MCDRIFSMKLLKRTDVFIITAILLLAGMMYLSMHLWSNDQGLQAEIYYKNRLVRTVDLSHAHEEHFSLPEAPGVHFHVHDGTISFEKSDCPDQVCVHAGELKKEFQSAACLPNHVVVRVVSKHPQKFEAQKPFSDYFDTLSYVISSGVGNDVLEHELMRLHKLYDGFRSYPDIQNVYALSHTTTNEWIEISPEIAELLELGITYYYLTDGYVNLCIGRITELWNAARESFDPVPPSVSELREAQTHTDIHSFTIKRSMAIEGMDRETWYFRKQDARMMFDLGAYAKGLALDKISEKLALSHPNDPILLVMGGSIKASGPYHGWKVGIKDPEAGGIKLSFVLPENMAVATSGDYERYFEYEGKRYHHIINPKTLEPSGEFRSVTILANSGALADALSTALFLLPMKDGLEMAQKQGAEVLYILNDGSLKTSPGFPVYNEN